MEEEWEEWEGEEGEQRGGRVGERYPRARFFLSCSSHREFKVATHLMGQAVLCTVTLCVCGRRRQRERVCPR